MGNINESMMCDERVISPLKAMLKAASTDGIGLVICSPYRDLERQKGLFKRKITCYMDAGLSYMDAYNMSSQAVTVPGASEHQIGLAFDIVNNEYAHLGEGFGETEEGLWLAENCYKYGFILRYPKEKEYITTIEYEPWHFRYVGREAAAYMTLKGLTLEEFWEEVF
jgi:D-alanyl-D-alanine carboxypeptidase